MKEWLVHIRNHSVENSDMRDESIQGWLSLIILLVVTTKMCILAMAISNKTDTYHVLISLDVKNYVASYLKY